MYNENVHSQKTEIVHPVQFNQEFYFRLLAFNLPAEIALLSYPCMNMEKRTLNFNYIKNGQPDNYARMHT